MGERYSGRPQPRARGTRGGRSQLQGPKHIPEKQKGMGEPKRQKSLKEQAPSEPHKDKAADKARYKGNLEAGTRAEAEKNQVEEQEGAIKKWQAGIRKVTVHQSTLSVRTQDRPMGGQDQPHTGQPLPNRTTQIGSPSPPAAGASERRTQAPPKK